MPFGLHHIKPEVVNYLQQDVGYLVDFFKGSELKAAVWCVT